MAGQRIARFCAAFGVAVLALTLSSCAGGVGPETGYPPASGSYVMVSVKSGDTVAGVAKRYRVQQDDVLAMNGLTDPSKRLEAGVLRVPAYGTAPAVSAANESKTSQVPVHSHDTQSSPLPPLLPKPAPSRHASSVPVPKPRPDLPTPQPAQASQWLDMQWFSSFVSDVPAAKLNAGTFDWPLQGLVISGFGTSHTGERNDGINIAATRGSPIHASADGTVTYVGDEIKAYGNLILIRHDNGYVTAYAHADSVVVERGERVSRGQLIAYAGATGDVDRPQLHFELRAGTKPVDPKPYLVASK